MIRNYVVVAVRGLSRDIGYTALNVLGLAVGMACCLLVAAFVQFETSSDAQHTRGDRIYRVLRETRNADGVARYSDGTSGPLAAAMQAEIPEVELAARMWKHWISVKSEDSHLYRSVVVVDPAFFEIFDFRLVSGSVSALRDPGAIFLTEGNARAFFGTGDPTGQALHIQGDQGEGDYIVAGVIEEPAHSTTVWFDLITAHHPAGFYRPQWEDWLPGRWRSTTNYVLLREGADPVRAESKVRPMLARHFGPELARTDTYHLQSLLRTRLYSEADFGIRGERGIRQVCTYAITAALVLLIACINFVNLSTARSSRRAREVGVRKVSGAHRRQLITQFLGESVLLSLLSFGVAVVLASLGRDTFGELVGIGLGRAWNLVPPAIVAAAAVGVLAGIYPALLLTRAEPVAVLKGIGAPSRGARLRRCLVVFQFAAAMLFVILAMTIHGQLTYIANQPLGFDEDHIVNLWMTNRKPELYGDLDRLKQVLLEHPNVISVAGQFAWGIMRPETVTAHEVGADVEHSFHEIGTDPDFLSTFRVKLVSGRNFRPRTTEALVNEAAVEAMDWDDPIGKQIKWPGEVGPLTIVGVVEDFHFESLRSPIGPVAMYHMWFASHMSVRISPTNVAATLDHFQEVWQKNAPEYPFDYQFLDEKIDASYHADRKAAKLATVSAGLSGLVACLGLFGLAALSAEQRTREIGIRKALGASVIRIVSLLSGEFLRLVLLAFVLATPIAHFAGQRWLQDFAYRFDLPWYIFPAVGLLALAVAAVSVSYQSVQAALADPVDSMRYE